MRVVSGRARLCTRVVDGTAGVPKIGASNLERVQKIRHRTADFDAREGCGRVGTPPGGPACNGRRGTPRGDGPGPRRTFRGLSRGRLTSGRTPDDLGER